MATLLRTSRLTETSLIVHWCSDQRGLVKTVAKGALRPKSPFAGKLDLFFEAELVYIPSRSSDLHTLKEVCVVNPRERIRKCYESTLAASYFVQWIETVAERETPIPELAALLRRALDYLGKQSPTVKAVRHFERELARAQGILDDAADPVETLEGLFGSIPKTRTELYRRLEPETAPGRVKGPSGG